MGNSLGSAEHLILLALLRLGGSSYSAPLVLEMEERTGKPVSAARVYLALRRLEGRGLVVSSKKEATPGEGGRGRRTFRITPKAVRELEETRATLNRFWEGLKPRLQGRR
ncbi:MAG: helix-turn-helix transcriptional regulator [Gemmatimonadales bacterium]